MKVCIAEKPSVAKEIAHIIGARTRKDGYFEGNGYQVTWTFGHFCTLLSPEEYRPQWKRWDLDTLPMLPDKFQTRVMSNSGVKKQFKIIKTLFKQATLVINCGDAGQEGELIQRWVIEHTGYKGPIQRLWISSLTKEAIEVGFKNLLPNKDFDSLFYAGFSRAIGDWLLGMNGTRLYTLKYGGYKQVLSIGRVQTPTLAMLVERHHEIENFKPTPYWELQTVYRETTFHHDKGKFNAVKEGQKVLDVITSEKLVIKDVEKKDGKEYAPMLFDLTGLQVYCNNKFGMTAEATLKTVQKLYEMKVVTYPRVDTTYLPNDMYPKIEGILKGLTTYRQFTESLINKKIRKTAKVFNDNKVTDHHAIIPTGEQRSLSDQEYKVYDIIVRRFIAVFYPDCKVAKTRVTAQIETFDFTAKGKEIIDPGWRVLFPSKRKSKEKSDKKEDQILPTFSIGESGDHVPQLLEKVTKPPKQYSEASLLRAMETAGKTVDDESLRALMKANGIGRPSTRANIIETLFKRKYARRQKKLVLPTTMGIQLIATIQNELLKSAELTGKWEKQLKEIEQGNYSASRFINDMKQMVDRLVTEVRMETGKPMIQMIAKTPQDRPKSKRKSKTSSRPKQKEAIATITCPKCKRGKMLKGHSNYGCSGWKKGCTMKIPFTYLDKKISDNQINRLLQKGSTVKLKGFKVNGSKVEGVIHLTDDGQLRFENKTESQKDKTSPPACPKCHTGTVIKGKTAYGCSRWKEGCDFVFTFQDIKKQAGTRVLSIDVITEIIKSYQ